MPNRSTIVATTGHHSAEEKHVMDYVRVLYKRRWIALPVFLLIFIVGALNALRETPLYEARTQLLIETDQPKVARLDQMFDNDGSYDEEFFQTQGPGSSRAGASRAAPSMP